MRLFIGIELDSIIKSQLKSASDELKKLARGNFSHPDNLHITLQFLGEKTPSEIEPVRQAIQQATAGFKPFSLSLDGPGRFERGAESIVWYGLSGDLSKLNNLWQLLCKALIENGITFEKNAFKPHITLARRVKTDIVWEDVFSKITVLKKPFTVEKIVLFESTRINGNLTYIPVCSQRF